ncbi:hypothetical protein GWI33_003097 [Rhynchophorus ferrugineus]|uniref:Uncharacterized protein n=1 Tax=Rhynchophorus ferrugineus TaxID=354439 RepID=A0A834IR71_RHYFE|nr:hypothetical protein GWI33_003097 [Rhynchophorus ferrugineus]
MFIPGSVSESWGFFSDSTEARFRHFSHVKNLMNVTKKSIRNNNAKIHPFEGAFLIIPANSNMLKDGNSLNIEISGPIPSPSARNVHPKPDYGEKRTTPRDRPTIRADKKRIETEKRYRGRAKTKKSQSTKFEIHPCNSDAIAKLPLLQYSITRPRPRWLREEE